MEREAMMTASGRLRYTARQRPGSVSRIKYVVDVLDATAALEELPGAIDVPRHIVERWYRYLRGHWEAIGPEERNKVRALLLDLVEQSGDRAAIAALRRLDEQPTEVAASAPD